jgi:hypothetical protein
MHGQRRHPIPDGIYPFSYDNEMYLSIQVRTGGKGSVRRCVSSPAINAIIWLYVRWGWKWVQRASSIIRFRRRCVPSRELSIYAADHCASNQNVSEHDIEDQAFRSSSLALSPRRKKKAVHKTSGTDDKRLQNTLKRLGVNTIPGIEEVNIFMNDDVIHFTNPKGETYSLL